MVVAASRPFLLYTYDAGNTVGAPRALETVGNLLEKGSRLTFESSLRNIVSAERSDDHHITAFQYISANGDGAYTPQFTKGKEPICISALHCISLARGPEAGRLFH